MADSGKIIIAVLFTANQSPCAAELHHRIKAMGLFSAVFSVEHHGDTRYPWRRAAAAAEEAAADIVVLFTPENVFFHAGALKEMISLVTQGGVQVASPDNFIAGVMPVVVSRAALLSAAERADNLPSVPDARRFIRGFMSPAYTRAAVGAPQPLDRPDLTLDADTAAEFIGEISALDAGGEDALAFYSRIVARIEEKQRAKTISLCSSIKHWPAAAHKRGARPKIAFLSNSSAVSGAESYILRLAASAAGSEFDFLFISPEAGELSERARTLGAAVAHVALAPLAAGAPAYMACVSEISRILSTEGAALLHINSIYACQMGAPAGRAAGVPVFCHVHDIAVEPRIAQASMLHSCDAVLAVSHAVKDAALSWGVPDEIIHAIHNGVDLAAFSPKPAGELPSGGTRFVMAANLVPWKGQRVFIRAAARVLEHAPDARFVIAGEEMFSGGGYREELEALIAGLGIDAAVQMPGRVEDVAALLRSCDVAVHASTVPDPFPYTVIEAMACGLPVIAADCGGTPEAVAEGAGKLYPPGDVDALAGAMIEFAESQQLREAAGLAARTRAEKYFDITMNTEKILAMYRAAVSRAGEDG